MCAANETFSKKKPLSEGRDDPIKSDFGIDQGPMGCPPINSLNWNAAQHFTARQKWNH
jgi:hypothetical protein